MAPTENYDFGTGLLLGLPYLNDRNYLYIIANMMIVDAQEREN